MQWRFGGSPNRLLSLYWNCPSILSTAFVQMENSFISENISYFFFKSKNPNPSLLYWNSLWIWITQWGSFCCHPRVLVGWMPSTEGSHYKARRSYIVQVTWSTMVGHLFTNFCPFQENARSKGLLQGKSSVNSKYYIKKTDICIAKEPHPEKERFTA